MSVLTAPAPAAPPRGAELRAIASPAEPRPSTLAGVSFAVVDYLLFYGGAAMFVLAPWWWAKVAGVVSFHGGLASPTPEDAKGIQARVLALHGADDPSVPPEEVQAFENEMRNAKVDWQLVSYGGAVHSFTDVDANRPGRARYDAKTAARAYRAMKDFFVEAWGNKG